LDCKDCRHFSSALVKLPITFEANFLPCSHNLQDQPSLNVAHSSRKFVQQQQYPIALRLAHLLLYVILFGFPSSASQASVTFDLLTKPADRLQVSNVAIRIAALTLNHNNYGGGLRGLVTHKMLLICAQSAQASHSSNAATSPLILGQHTSSDTMIII